MLDDPAQPQDSSPIGYTLIINEEEVDIKIINKIVQIDIESSINRVPTAYILLNDGMPDRQDFPASRSEIFIPGSKIEVIGGYSNQEVSLFRGVIVKQNIEIVKSKSSYLRVVCKDPVFQMTIDRKSRHYRDMNEIDIFQSIIGNYNNKISLEAGSVNLSHKHAEVTQYQMTDWDFLIMNAEKIGVFISVRDGEIHLHKLPTSGSADIEVIYGQNVLSLDLELEGRYQFSSVEAQAWDDNVQEILTGTAQAPSDFGAGDLHTAELSQVNNGRPTLRHSGMLSQQQLDNWAEGLMTKSSLSRIRGTVGFKGDKRAVAGAFIELAGVGERFSGTNLITGVQQSLGADWITTVQIGADIRWHYEQYNTSLATSTGFSSAISGFQVGIVTQLLDDSEGRERIRVRLPSVDANDSKGNWMRWISLLAGPGYGVVFRPDINTEVLVGFLNDDPNQGVVLGGLYSSANQPPIEASDDNHEKGIISRGNLKLILNDDEKSVRIATPNGIKLELSEQNQSIVLEDEHNNHIKMSKDGIQIESASHLVLKANGHIQMEGINIVQEAEAGFIAESSTSMEIVCKANTVVKGGIVQIN